MRIAAIVPAAGKGRRFKSKRPKAFFSVMGKPLLLHTLARLKNCFSFAEIIVAAPPAEMQAAKDLLKRSGFRKIKITRGARSRAGSVKNALSAVSKKCNWVLVHDAARPLVSRGLVGRTLAAARHTGAAICALPALATVKKVARRDKTILRTEDRESLFLAQTPQVFRKDLLLRRYRQLGNKALGRTDEAALFDGSKTKVRVTEGEARNIKVTTPEDVELLKYYLKTSLRGTK